MSTAARTAARALSAFAAAALLPLLAGCGGQGAGARRRPRAGGRWRPSG
ncbi:hypothetical protein ACGRHY_09085 [Streptomyces sp. HK10]